MEKQQQSSSKVDRKTVEKNRRNQMKTLYSELSSLIPQSHRSKGGISLPDQLDEAVNYIKNLENKLERMKEKKNYLMGTESCRSMSATMGGNPPQIEIHCAGSSLEVVLVSGMDSQSLFFKIIHVLHDEGAITINANFSIANDSIFHTIHAEVILGIIFVFRS
ncbi:hypothetical protein Sjap_025724 [Stephania japonica]|uniref:BHLH domain-containing protein n=1 Tax=Stephania japonica TaxID=461633 RepID=A0AAP0EA10_9MAGN